MISVQWMGFQDPHSGIDHFEWCVGSHTGTCDVLDFKDCLLSNSVTFTGVSLADDKDYYVTVKATNRVGLSTSRSSMSFAVDTTPPYLVEKPHFVTSRMGISYRNNTQWDNSLLRLKWSFHSNQSPISEQIIILKSHRNGHTVLQRHTMTNQKHITIQLSSDNLLKDGDKYTAWITACNSAGLCNHSSTDEILIDSSPPHLGGFHKNMLWETKDSKTEVLLQWYGFVDVESDVETYFIEVSRNYSGSELSDGPVEIPHADGSIQNTTLVLSDKVSNGEKIVLTIWAKNGVGLISPLGKVTVTLVATESNLKRGFLEIQRHSCDSHYCNNDCTCAVIGRKCTDEHMVPLHCVEETYQHSNLTVKFSKDSFEESMTASSKCLAMSWTFDGSNDDVLRYEWSMGLRGDKYGAGIFDKLTENVWYDVGKQKQVVHCLPNPRQLNHREEYVGYVRAWHSDHTYQTFVSDPVIVDLTPPSVRRGSYIMESIDACITETDYMNNTYAFYVCWKSVFVEREGHIIKFSLQAGTSVGGMHIYKRAFKLI